MQYEHPEVHPLIREWYAITAAVKAVGRGEIGTATERQVLIGAELYRSQETVAVEILRDSDAMTAAFAVGIVTELVLYLTSTYEGQTAEEWWQEHESLMARRRQLALALEMGMPMDAIQHLTWADLFQPAHGSSIPDNATADIPRGDGLPEKDQPPLRLKRRRGRPRKATK